MSSEGKPLPGKDPHVRTAETFDSSYTWKVMALMAAMVMTVMYIEGMLTPSLPQIQTEFGVTYSQVSLVLSAYLLTGVALSPIMGKLGDVYGKKRVMTSVLAFYAVAVSVTGFSPNFEFMVVARAVQGVGLTIFPLGLSLVREEFPREMVPKAQGILSGLFGAGFAVSLPLGAFISNSFGWRFTYHSAIPVVVLITVAAFLILRESPYRRPNAFVDYWGAGFLAMSLGLFVLALSEGQPWGWGSAPIAGMFLTGLLLLVATALVELHYHRKGKEVILDVRMLRMRNVLVTNVVITVAGLGMFLAFQALTFRLYDPANIVHGFGLDTFQIGLSFVAFAVPMLIFAPLTGLLVTRVGTKPLTLVGGIVGAGGFYLVTLTTTLPQLLAAMFVIGMGLAMLNSAVINLLVLTVEPRDMGLATAMNATFRNMGSAVGAPLAGSLMSSYTKLVPTRVQVHGVGIWVPLPYPDSTAFLYAFLIAAVVTLAAAVLSLFSHEILGKRAHKEDLASDEREDTALPATPAAAA